MKFLENYFNFKIIIIFIILQFSQNLLEVIGLKIQVAGFYLFERIEFFAIKDILLYYPGPGLLSGYAKFVFFLIEQLSFESIDKFLLCYPGPVKVYYFRKNRPDKTF